MKPPIAANDNIGFDDPLRLEEAVRFAFPHGGMTASGLRREARGAGYRWKESPTRISRHSVAFKK